MMPSGISVWTTFTKGCAVAHSSISCASSYHKMV
jgi:hypothetical protein